MFHNPYDYEIHFISQQIEFIPQTSKDMLTLQWSSKREHMRW